MLRWTVALLGPLLLSGCPRPRMNCFQMSADQLSGRTVRVGKSETIALRIYADERCGGLADPEIHLSGPDGDDVPFTRGGEPPSQLDVTFVPPVAGIYSLELVYDEARLQFESQAVSAANVTLAAELPTSCGYLLEGPSTPPLCWSDSSETLWRLDGGAAWPSRIYAYPSRRGLWLRQPRNFIADAGIALAVETDAGLERVTGWSPDNSLAQDVPIAELEDGTGVVAGTFELHTLKPLPDGGVEERYFSHPLFGPFDGRHLVAAAHTAYLVDEGVRLNADGGLERFAPPSDGGVIASRTGEIFMLKGSGSLARYVATDEGFTQLGAAAALLPGDQWTGHEHGLPIHLDTATSSCEVAQVTDAGLVFELFTPTPGFSCKYASERFIVEWGIAGDGGVSRIWCR